mgnify:CR=1 FL=1|jgi:hypothetical protein
MAKKPPRGTPASQRPVVDHGELVKDTAGFILSDRAVAAQRSRTSFAGPCIVCLTEGAQYSLTRNHGYRLNCLNCMSQAYFNGPRSLKLIRAWRRALQNPSIHAQIAGMLAEIVILIDKEDRRGLAPQFQMELDEHS